MAPRYNATIRTARMQAVATALATGKLVIGTSGLSGFTGVLATIDLTATGATVTDDVMTLHGLPLEAVASDSGTAAKAELRNSSNATVVDNLTVGTTGADILIASTTIALGQTVRCTGGTITHAT